jgi:PAS domain S-box-containing protein
MVVVYVAAAAFGLSLASLHNNVSPVWPPTGIAIACVLLFGLRIWPAVFLGAFLANLRTDVSVPTAAAIATGNTLEAVAAYWFLKRNDGFENSFTNVRQVLRFVVYAAMVAPAISATIGISSLCLSNSATWSGFPRLWFTWWLGDGSGALIVAPFVLALFGHSRDASETKTWESVLLLSMLFLTAMVVLGGWSPTSAKNYPLTHLCVPFLLWAAVRGSQRVLTSATLLLTSVAVWGAARGFGPFVEASSNESLLLLQSFIDASALTTLVLFAAITERRRVQKEKRDLGTAVRVSQQRVQDIVSQAPGVVWEAWGEPDATTQRIGFVSNHVEKMLGYSEAEWLSTPNFWLSIVHPEDRERAAQEAATIFASGKGGKSRFRWIRKDGRDVWVEAQSIVICDDSGKSVGMRGITIDITESAIAEQERAELLKREREARKQAEEASRLRDEFLATVSHELRTPLNAVVGWSRMLRTGQLDRDGTNHAVEVIERNAWAQKQIIEDLLDVSRIISGKLNLAIVRVDLTLVVYAAVDVVRPAAEAKQIHIDVLAEAADVVVRGDADRLQQVAWNLLANAVKFTPNSGTVKVSLERNQDVAMLTVSDTGPGLPNEFLSRAFERFTQADSSTTRQHGGLGLGLAIVRHLVELHGGTVSAANRAEGSGAVFTVILPAAENLLTEMRRPIDSPAITDTSIEM